VHEQLKERIVRRLDGLADERGYQVLDFIEFLESKYAERSAPTNFFARLTERVEDTMRAGRIPVKAIGGTLSAMDSAGKVMKGVVAAGKAVVDEAVRAAAPKAPPAPPAIPKPEPPPK
jgi:hypothetical protein